VKVERIKPVIPRKRLAQPLSRLKKEDSFEAVMPGFHTYG
jgi:hypothetical protein